MTSVDDVSPPLLIVVTHPPSLRAHTTSARKCCKILWTRKLPIFSPVRSCTETSDICLFVTPFRPFFVMSMTPPRRTVLLCWDCSLPFLLSHLCCLCVFCIDAEACPLASPGEGRGSGAEHGREGKLADCGNVRFQKLPANLYLLAFCGA